MTEIKQLDSYGRMFLANLEGVRLKPYKDSVGIPTIGIGMTYYPDTGKRVTMQDPPLTTEQVYEYFSQIVKPYETTVWSLTRDDINQQQFNALVALTYNIGVAGFKGSTVLRRVNANPKDERIKAAFEMWRKPAVLLGRRRKEWAVYFS